MERRLSVRRPTSENVYLYCKQLEIERCRPTNISSRGVYIDLIPKRAYVGRRIQLVFVIDRGRTAKMIRVFAVIAHISVLQQSHLWYCPSQRSGRCRRRHHGKHLVGLASDRVFVAC